MSRWFLGLIAGVVVIQPVWAEPLKGGIEQTAIPGGAQGNVMQGGAQGTGLTGSATDSNIPLNSQQGRADQMPQQQLQGNSNYNPMELSANSDPDAGNQELEIEWDRWRNTLIQAIQMGTLAHINVQNEINFVWDQRSQMMQSRYPNGTSAWYYCNVLPNRRIININLTSHSRYPSYDQAVLQAINDLQGSRILKYPNGSRRQMVTQEAGVSTAAQTSSQTFHFGDVERQRR